MAVVYEDDMNIRRRSEVLFWCFAVVMLLLFLGVNALWGLEGRNAEIVRQMLVSGDFFNSGINGLTERSRLPVSYWGMLPGVFLFGADEFALRLPSVCAAIVLLWSVKMIARKLFDEQTALIAMWVTLSTYGFLFWARIAAPDIANAAAVSCAVVCFLYRKEETDFKGYLAFYLLLGTGTLFKGIPMVGVVLLLIFPWILEGGNFKSYLNIRHLSALCCGIAVVLLPYWICGLADTGLVGKTAAGSGIDMLWKHHILRLLDARSTREPVYSYFYHLPRILLPWSVIFITGIVIFIKKYKELPADFLALLKGIFLAFILFLISGSRSWYYLLPLVPFCSVVTAAVLNGFAGDSVWINAVVKTMRFILMLTASFAVSLPVALPLQKMFNIALPPLAVGIAFAGGVVVLLLLTFDSGEDNLISRIFAIPRKTVSLTVGIAIAMTIAFCGVIPQFTVFRTEKRFVLSLKKQTEGITHENIFFFNNSPGSRVLFYFGAAKPVVFSGDIKSFLDANIGERVAIISNNKKETLERLEKQLAELQYKTFEVNKPDIAEERNLYEKSGKDKLLAWIFDIPVQQISQ